MPISFKMNADPKFVAFEMASPITVDEFMVGYKTLFSDPSFEFNLPVIWDLSNLDLTQIPIGDVRQLPPRIKEFTKDRGDNYKAALVTTRTMDYQLLRMYITIVKLLGRKVHLRLFPTVAEAHSWIAK